MKNCFWNCEDCIEWKQSIFRKMIGFFLKKYKNYGYCAEQLCLTYRKKEKCVFFEKK